MTATERRFSFELPLHDQRISQGLYGISGILRQQAPTVASEALDPAPETAIGEARHAYATAANTELPTATYTAQPAGPERMMALMPPSPIREHEHRG